MQGYDFEFLEHTADVGLAARGKDLAEAFAAAGYGFSALMADLTRAEPLEQRAVEVTAEDEGGLLVAWLSQLLYLFEVEGFLACQFAISHIDGGSLRAQVWGDRFDPEKHPPNMAVKAVTYHQLQVVHNDGYEVRVYLDI